MESARDIPAPPPAVPVKARALGRPGCCLVLLLLHWGGLQLPGQAPLRQAHSHNDYERARPLLDALDLGFCSVEADVWLVEGKLLVAHDREKIQAGHTLEHLYLQPLRERAQRHGGRIHPGGPSLTLLIDVKSDATNTWLALRDTLRGHARMLTRFHPGGIETNAVTVIISGNRARELMSADTERLAAYDGRLEDLGSNAPAHFIPLISDNWARHFKWKARPEEGRMPAAERDRLADLVRQTHAQGKRLRLWATPDHVSAWKELRAAGVDLINTDDLPGLAAFLRGSVDK